MCEGKIHSTNDIKQLALDMHNELIPTKFKKYNLLKISFNEWILDLKKRLDQFKKLIEL